MARTQPRKLKWHKRYHSDALTGFRGLNLEQRGAYQTILDLLYDSDRATGIPDRPRLIAGYLDVSPRKWEALRAELLALGKLIETDGFITNGRYLREINRTAQLSEKRAEAGQKGGNARAKAAQGSLDLSAENDASTAPTEPEPHEKPSNLNGASKAIATRLPEPSTAPEIEPTLRETGTSQLVFDPRKQAESELATEWEGAENAIICNNISDGGQAIAKQAASYTRATPEARKKESTPSTPDSETARPPVDDDDDFDLVKRVEELAQFAGLNVTVPAKLTNAIDQLRQWQAEGIDYRSVILPTIRARTASSPTEPVHSLRWFDASVRKAAAVARSTPPRAKPVAALPKLPIDRVDGDDERIGTFRRRLEYAIGSTRYAERFAPEHVAITVQDDRLLDVTFRTAGEMRLTQIGSDPEESTMSSIAQRLSLSLRLDSLDRSRAAR